MVTKPKTNRRTSSKKVDSSNSHRFEPARLDSLFGALDAIAWIEHPTSSQVAQFAGIDPRTAGKLIKNANQIGLVDNSDGGLALRIPYPYKGSEDQKRSVVKEALAKLPILVGVRQFLKLGDQLDVAIRKSATVEGIVPFNPTDLNPLLDWARSLDALNPNLLAEDLLDEAEKKKETRHSEDGASIVAFISHSSVDKPFVRQLASDLTAAGIGVWVDEQRIRVGESIPEKIAQGLAESDYFLIVVSQKSIESEWVRKELNNALVSEVKRRKVHVLPLKLDDAEIPAALSDKKYADFSSSYKSGLEELVVAMREDVNG